MKLLFEHRLRVDGLEFGLEVTDGMTVGAAIGATASVGEFIAIVLRFVARTAPAEWRERRALLRSVWTGWTYQFPFPPPSFLTFFGSAST